jgi:hypothetical protein
MWVIKLFAEQVIITLVISFALYGLWRWGNPGKKF